MLENARQLYREMEKERLVSGYTIPSKPSSDGFYHVYLPDESKKSGRRQIKAKNIDNLKEKIYQFEKRSRNLCKTFKETFDLVLEEKVKYIRDPEKLISAKNTIKVYRSNYKRFFDKTEFETLFVDEISKEEIEDLIYNILSTQSTSKKMLLSLRGILKSVFSYAYEQYWIIDNPYSRIDFKKYSNMTIRSTPPSKRVHSASDIERMLEYIHKYQKENPSYMPTYALELQLLMGLRRGEVAPLEWTDIVEDSFVKISKEQITVRKQSPNERERWVIVNHTKTYVDREFPLTESLRAFFNRLARVHFDFGLNSKYLFPDNRYESGVINNTLAYHFYYNMCKDLGIELCRNSMKGPHSFRRNGITKVSNSPEGNLLIASILYGNSVESASKHYYTGIDLNKAKSILEG